MPTYIDSTGAAAFTGVTADVPSLASTNQHIDAGGRGPERSFPTVRFQNLARKNLIIAGTGRLAIEQDTRYGHRKDDLRLRSIDRFDCQGVRSEPEVSKPSETWSSVGQRVQFREKKVQMTQGEMRQAVWMCWPAQGAQIDPDHQPFPNGFLQTPVSCPWRPDHAHC